MRFGKALMEKLKELKYPRDHIFIERFADYPLPIEGCTPEEIEEIKTVQNLSGKKLPQVYIEFLLHLGKRSGDLLIGYDLNYRYLIGYNFTEACNEQLIADGHHPLSDRYYVFMNKQTVIHWFFSIDEGDDPFVYEYCERSGDEETDEPYLGGPIKLDERLSDFLTDFIAQRESKEAQSNFIQTYALEYRG